MEVWHVLDVEACGTCNDVDFVQGAISGDDAFRHNFVDLLEKRRDILTGQGVKLAFLV